ncbi:LytTR family DNA-binding domain-containing protein [Ekhidna sp.]
MKASARAKATLIVSSGLFLGIVLFLYEAFGIDQGVSFSGHSLIERTFFFSLGVSSAFALNELFIIHYLRINSFVRYFCWNTWEIISAGSVTYLLFNYFWNFTESYWQSYFLLIGEFTSVMIVPFAIYYLMVSLEKNASKAIDLQVFTSTNGKERIAIKSNQLMFVKAEDNYVSIVYRSNGSIETSIIRRRLSDLEKSYPNLMRVHRSYLVNPLTIHRVEQKSRSVKIYFEQGETVPVSNSYIQQIEDRLNHHSEENFATKL